MLLLGTGLSAVQPRHVASCKLEESFLLASPSSSGGDPGTQTYEQELIDVSNGCH